MLLVTLGQSFLSECLEHIFLGIIQGFTEFLPISSTAHLKAIPTLLGMEDPGVSLTASLQLGSILAILFYFKKDLKSIYRGFKSILRHRNVNYDFESRLTSSIFIGTIPILIIGFFIKFFWQDYESSPLRSITSIGLVSIFMSIILALAELKGARKKTLNSLVPFDGFKIGLAQVFALLPGASRSGVTLSASLLNGWDRESSARYSFLLGLPSITIAGFVELSSMFNISNFHLIPLFLGILSSSISSWFAIDFLLRYLRRNNTWLFINYRLVFGVVLISYSLL